jgi:hypothetical protein
MGTQIKILAPYLINGFTTVGLSVDPDPPAVGYYNLFLRDNEEYCLQNSDNDIVVINGGGGSVPVATSASGGGTIGKLTVDSDFGFSIAAGILTFNLSSTGGLEFQTGLLKTKLDGATITSSAAGIKVADDSITNAQINTSAGITRSKLASGTNNALVRNSSSGVMTDSTNLTFSEGGNDHLLVVKANAAQSTNLHEWQNSAGTAMSYVDSAGNILVPAAPTTGNMLVNKTYADALASSSIIGSAVLGSNGDTFDVSLSENITADRTVLVTLDIELSAAVNPDWYLADSGATQANFIYRFWGGAHAANGVNARIARISSGGSVGQRVIVSGFLKITEDSKLCWTGQYENGLLTHYGQAGFYQASSTTASFSTLRLSTNQSGGTNAIGAGSKIVVMKLW